MKQKRPTSSPNADQRLSQLIQLKQSEKPNAEFWDKFDQEFRSRQLTTFVQIQPLHHRLRKACLLAARKAAPPAAAAGAVTLTIFAVNNTSHIAKSTSSELKESNAMVTIEAADERESYFVVQTASDEGRAAEVYPTDTIYQMNVLDGEYKSLEGYQLNATPVTFSSGVSGQGLGTQLLSTQESH